MKLKYFKSLDGLRTIAAFMVIIAHFFSPSRMGGSGWVTQIAKFGNSGVSLFFVLSGFVITRILINSVNNHNYFMTFYIRRILRIFPLYYSALLCYYYLPFLLKSLYHFSLSFSHTFYYFTYLQNFARTFNWKSSGPLHFWSLAVEEHFYLLWPAVVLFAYRYKKVSLWKIALLLVLASFLLRYLMLAKGYYTELFTFTRLDQLVLGGMLAILERKGLLEMKYKHIYFLSIVIGGISFIACIGLPGLYQGMFKHNALGLLYFGVIGSCVISEDKGNITGFLKLGFMQYLGMISYGIYVWHALAVNVVDKYFLTKNLLIDLVMVFMLTISIASFSYWILEKPFLNLKKYFIYA
ncbi:MAG: acyltransferase [Chitinophagaceae bacterium]|nr:acyltransferase [Chitinophagaceae bacterium]